MAVYVAVDRCRQGLTEAIWQAGRQASRQAGRQVGRHWAGRQ